MKLISILLCLLIGCVSAQAQEATDGLESLSLPADEPKPAAPPNTELSLPTGNTATSTVSKSPNSAAVGKK